MTSLVRMGFIHMLELKVLNGKVPIMAYFKSKLVVSLRNGRVNVWLRVTG
jgi:hypothetical protein